MKQNLIWNYLDKTVFFFVNKINDEINLNEIFNEINNGTIKLISYNFNISIIINIINNYAINIFDNYKYINFFSSFYSVF